MNNKIVPYILGFGSSIVTGLIVGKIYERHYAKIFEKEARETEKYYQSVLEAMPLFTPKSPTDSFDDFDVDANKAAFLVEGGEVEFKVDIVTDEFRDGISKVVPARDEYTKDAYTQYLNRHTLATSSTGEAEEELGVYLDEEQEDHDLIVVEGVPYSKERQARLETIRMISDREYFESDTAYIQNTLTYFVQDDTLADENEERLEDKLGILGYEALSALRNAEFPWNPVFVVNPSLEMEYEIIVEDNSFVEVVLGVDPTAKDPGDLE